MWILNLIPGFLGTKLGRIIAGILVVVVGVGFMILKVFSLGQAKERAKQNERSLKAVKTRMKTDDERHPQSYH